MGISESDQAQIFERFHSLRRSGPKGGFGVGLWVTRQLVRALEGEIAVASAAGAGSTFTVKLPLKPGRIRWALTKAAGRLPNVCLRVCRGWIRFCAAAFCAAACSSCKARPARAKPSSETRSAFTMSPMAAAHCTSPS